jgi:hypothetical protein
MALSGNEELRRFMDKLTSTNVDRHVKLPMIAVMGDVSVPNFLPFGSRKRLR